MLKDFEAYQLAIEFYRRCEKVKVPRFLREQLDRASSSIALNLAEGSGKRTPKDQSRFYTIALGSLRECQAILDLEGTSDPKLRDTADRLGAMLFKLSRITPNVPGTNNGKRNGNLNRQTPNGGG